MLLSLHRALTTTNPGGEPDNGEAVRQLVFFANSLHNRRLCQPPPVPLMKSWTCFTPHYQEEVACTMGGLHATTEDNASLLTILKSLHPDEWANLTERINLVDTAAVDLVGREETDQAVQQWASDRSQVPSCTLSSPKPSIHPTPTRTLTLTLEP